MGEAKRRGTLEDRKRQAIHAAEWEAAKRKVEMADRRAAQGAQGTSARRGNKSMILAIAAMIGIAAGGMK